MKDEYTVEKLAFPKEVMLEVTNCCNNKCFFCSGTVSERKRGIVEFELMNRLIEEAYSYGARKISFHGMGEPCLCKELSQYVAKAKELGYTYIYLDTNGVLATPEVINPVLDAGLDSLKFSIHAASGETYKKITGNDQYNTVVENLRRISNYIKEHKLQCKLIAYFAENKFNENEADKFKEIMQEQVDEVWIRPIHNGSGVMKSNIEYAVTEKIATMKQLPCSELYNRMTVNWEGFAIACCTDWTGQLIYGDAKKEDLLVLWNNETITRIRQEHRSAETLCEICASCMSD